MWGCTGSLRTGGSEADPQLHPSVTRRQQQEQTAVELTFWCLKNKGWTSSFSFHYCTWQWCVPDLEIWTAKSGSNSSLLIWETGSRYAAAKCPLWTVRTARAQFQTNAHSGNPQGKRKYEQCVWTCVCARAREGVLHYPLLDTCQPCSVPECSECSATLGEGLSLPSGSLNQLSNLS